MIKFLMKSLNQAVDVLLSGNTYIIHLIPIYKHKVDILNKRNVNRWRKELGELK